MSILQFKENAPVRMQMVKGEPWFVAKDVCEILGLAFGRSSVNLLDADEKGVHSVDTLLLRNFGKVVIMMSKEVLKFVKEEVLL